MFRKSLLALAALGTLAGTALVPNAASAGWHGKHFHHHRHNHWPRYVAYVGPSYVSCFLTKRYIDTPFGVKVKWVKVCA